ncbi:hypothetical protein J3R03_006750 [Actinoplanes couchii]|nr:hypothetical protein [Actinoplanes couchii]
MRGRLPHGRELPVLGRLPHGGMWVVPARSPHVPALPVLGRSSTGKSPGGGLSLVADKSLPDRPSLVRVRLRTDWRFLDDR